MAKTGHPLRSFYRPHARVQFTGELVNAHTGEVTVPPSMTKQEFVAECDINNVIKAFSRTGMLTHVSAKAAQGAYQDLPDPIEFQDALGLVKEAEASFMSLPAKLRDRFGHDPVRFLAFLEDPDNYDEAKRLGLLKPEIAAKAENPAAEAKEPKDGV